MNDKDRWITVFSCDDDERAMFDAYSRLYGIKALCIEEPIDERNASAALYGCPVSVNHRTPVTGDALSILGGRGVRYLSSRSVGLNHVDESAARASGIVVEGVDYSPDSVAEYAVMLMLMTLRGACFAIQRARRHDFRLDATRATELRDARVGIVGMGRIGYAVIDKLAGFGCEVWGCDRRGETMQSRVRSVRIASLDELLARCDIISLHLPLNESTRRVIDKPRFDMMKPGAILVNTARGALVDHDALMDALNSGQVGAAALDVVDSEEGWFYHDCAAHSRPSFERLLHMPNVIVTPHTAFYTQHSLRDVVMNTIQNCARHAGGR